MSEQPIPLFDPIVHAPHRLRICAVLEPWDEYEFSALRDVIKVSDSVLSKQLSQLQDAKYVILRRGTRDGRQRVWVRLTALGREAFQGHVLALREIVGESRTAGTNPESTSPMTAADAGTHGSLSGAAGVG